MPGTDSKTSTQTRKALISLLDGHEEWLMERILHYAIQQDFTRYTSTLKEAWRVSIEGLSRSLIAMLKHCDDIPEFGPDENWTQDPCGAFGRNEAEKHRNRGITMAMFLGLMKYYRQSYLDLLRNKADFAGDRCWAELFIQRVFDRVEISFCQCWSEIDAEGLIADLQRQNRFLANEKNKFLTLFESYSIPCFLVNRSGYLDCMNLPACRVFGYGLTAGEHYYQAEKNERIPDWLFAEIATFAEGNAEEQVFEKELQVEQGERIFVVSLRRMLDISGKYSGVVVTMNDVTRQTQDRRQLEKAHAELKETQVQMLRREKMASIGRLATGMAHEINNPLAIMLQNLQVIERRLLPDLQRNIDVARETGLDLEALQRYMLQQQIVKMHQAIKDSGTRAASIVKKLSSLNRSSTTAVGPVDIRHLIDKAVLLVLDDGDARRKETFAKLEIIRDYTDDSPSLFCYELELQQVLFDIICNAAESMYLQKGRAQEDGRILLRVTREEQQLVVEIEDNGPGMTEEECQQIFDPFYTTKDPGQGLGLGLTMAYKIIQRHEGQISVESTPGVGSRFVVRLPVNNLNLKLRAD